MKVTVFALIAALCFVAVSVNAGVVAPPEDIDLEFVPQEFADEIVEIDDFNLLRPLFWTLRTALRTVKGVNCSIKEVLNIRTAGQNFLEEMTGCGGTVSKQVQSVITAVNAVISTCNTIISSNESVCKTAGENPTQKTGIRCFWSYWMKMISLKNQVSKVISLANKVPSAGVGAVECANMARNELTSTFIQFPVAVKTCSKLTSN